jgi:hypothetical protein
VVGRRERNEAVHVPIVFPRRHAPLCYDQGKRGYRKPLCREIYGTRLIALDPTASASDGHEPCDFEAARCGTAANQRQLVTVVGRRDLAVAHVGATGPRCASRSHRPACRSLARPVAASAQSPRLHWCHRWPASMCHIVAAIPPTGSALHSASGVVFWGWIPPMWLVGVCLV